MLRVVLVLVLAAAAGPTFGQTPPLDHNDYADGANWLCLPGRAGDACDVDLSATEVDADGSTRILPFKKAADPAIDCFYVYPTVSRDPGPLATMKIEHEEKVVIEQQFARFAAVCRPFAPVYRQSTVTGLIARIIGHPLDQSRINPETPYQDVLDAWNYYLAHDNHGRGVVLIGHSQGSFVLGELIAKEIDGKPEQARLVSAILMGTVLVVPKGADVGGDFKHVPLCRTPGQVGCAIAFASFRDTVPPPPTSFFGRPREANDALAAACVNPANLAGGEGPLKSYLPSGSEAIVANFSVSPNAWAEGKTVTTPFVTVPGLLSAHCATSGPFTYLAVHVHGDQGGPRVKDITGDVVIFGHVQPEWGLHLIDANLTIGNLIDVVRAQSAAWADRR